MLEIFLSNPIIGVGITLILLAVLQKTAPIRSWRMHLAFALAVLVISAQYAARLVSSVAMLWILAALQLAYVGCCVCLFIWREKNIPCLTIRQRVVMSVLAVLVYIPAAVLNADVRGTWNSKASWHEALSRSSVKRIPSEILEMNLHPVGGSEGMRRVSTPRYVDGRWTNIVYLEDETSREAEGSVFVSVRRRCTLKTLTPFSVIAETDVMLSSESELVIRKARSIAEDIHVNCGLEMLPVANASITVSLDADVQLYYGRGGNLEATIFWVPKGEGHGVLRLVLRDVGLWCDDTTNSLIYVESANI